MAEEQHTAGSFGFIPHPYMHDRYALVQIVKARALGGMWEVRQWAHKDWDYPARRKVTEFLPLEGDPQYFREQEMALSDRLREAEKSARNEYHTAIRALRARKETDE